MIIAIAVISLFLISGFALPASGDVLQSMGTGSGSASSRYGWNITYAGDVNNDGLDDVLVGAPGENKAYLFLGPVANLNSASASATYTGVASSDFGWDVRCAFDLDMDSYDDIIIGAPGEDSAYIFMGSATPSSKTSAAADVTLDGVPGSKFGFSVCGVRDFANDLNWDVFVGAPYDDAAATDAGAVYLFNDVASRAAWTALDVTFGSALNMTGSNANELFGFSISYAGNFDGDGSGLGDVVIGAPGTNSNCGAAYVENGKPVHPTYPKGSNTITTNEIDSKVFGNTSASMAGNKFGYSVSNASNFGGNSNDDIIVGAPNKGTGYAYVFFGSSSPLPGAEVGITTGADFVILGDMPGDDFGHSVSWLGDFNADGKDDIVIGAVWNNSKAGCAYVFYGPRFGSTTAGTADLYEFGQGPSDGFGFSVSGGGLCTPAPTNALLVSARAGNTGKAYAFVVNKIPSLGTLTSNPATGNGATSFTFTAIYTDSENDAPDVGYPKLRLYSDSAGTAELSISPITMTSTDSTYTDGSLFTASTTLPHGQVYYRVQAKAASGDDRVAWSSGVKTGPIADLIAPGKVTNLKVEPIPSPDEDDHGKVILSWTFPGDDGATGAVKNLTLRYRNATEGNFTEANFNESKIVVEYYIDPAPKVGGQSLTYTVDPFFGLKPGEQYYFGIRGTDEEDNWGPLSNLVDTQAYLTPNVDPPDPIKNIVAEDVPDDTGGAINLTWELSTAPDLAYYRIYGGTNAFINVASITPIIDNLVTGDGWQVITSLGPGKPLVNGNYYFFAVTAVDIVGLENPQVNGSWVRVIDDSAPMPHGITGVTLEDTPNDNGKSLTVSWDESTAEDFDCYKIYISDASYTTLIGKNNETSVFDKATTTVKLTTMGGYELKDGKKYWVTVTQETINAKENRTVDSENTDGPQYAMNNNDVDGPGTISGLTVMDRPGDKGGVLNLVWARSTSPKFGFYNIYISEDPITTLTGLTPEKVLSTNVDKTDLGTIKGDVLTDGKEYYVAVTVVSYNGVETKSITLGSNSVGPVESINNSDSIAPPGVEDFELTGTTDTSISFSWTPLEILDFQKYQIIYYPKEEPWSEEPVDIEDITVNKWTVTDLDPKTIYVFNISAIDDNSNRGPYSADITAKPGAENVLPIIEGVSWSPQKPTTETTKITFTVTAEDPDGNSDNLRVEWDFDNDGEMDKIGWSQDHDGYTEAKSYEFTVTVEDEAGGRTNKTFTITISEPEKSDDDGGNALIFAVVGIFAFLIIVAIVVVVIIIMVIRKKKKPAEEGPQALEPEALPPGQPQPMGPAPGQPKPMGPAPGQPKPMGPPPGQAQPAAQQPRPMPQQPQQQQMAQPQQQQQLPPAQQYGQQPVPGAQPQQPDYGAQPDMGQPDMYGQDQPQDFGMDQPPLDQPGMEDPMAQPQPGAQPTQEDDPFAI